ncbi:MAG: carboxypeptidase-like regulatory domain-containing protein, partial [Terriglobia bacterium]
MPARCPSGRTRIRERGIRISAENTHTHSWHTPLFISKRAAHLINLANSTTALKLPAYQEGPAMFSRENTKGFFLGFSLLIAMAVSFFIPTSAGAQVVGATVSGTVTDPSGSVIPHAQISIRNSSTGVVRNVASDTAGLYTAPNLLPGSYQITISARGFRTQVRTGITLTVGAQQVLNITMQIGQVTETVQVLGAAPTVQLGTSSISAVVNSTTV